MLEKCSDCVWYYLIKSDLTRYSNAISVDWKYSKGGFEKVKGGNGATILCVRTMSHGWRLKHDFCCLFTWRCHKQDKGKTEGDGEGEGGWGALRGCRALCVNRHNDFVTQDSQIKHFELFCEGKQNQLTQP